MAFNQKEMEIVRYGVQSGKSRQEVEAALARLRTGAPVPAKETAGGFMATIKDIPSDVAETFSGAVESVSKGVSDAQDVRERVTSGETTPLAGTLQTIGSGLRAGANVVGQALLGAGKLFTSPAREEKIAEGVSGIAKSVVDTPQAQEAIRQYESLSEEEKRNVQGTLGVVEGVTTAFGFAPIVSKLKGVISDSARTALEASDAALTRVRNVPEIAPVIKQPTSAVLKDIRYALSDIDPQVETVLQRSTFDDVNRYFQQARNAKADPAKNTPLELAGNKAEDAFDAISEARKLAVQGKKSILESVATQRVPGNTLNDVMSSGIQRMKEKFGADISSKGEVTTARGRTLQLDVADQKVISDFFTRFNSLGVAPTLKQVDDFVDYAQSILYKQSKTVSKYEVASEPVVRELQKITGDLNTRLKDEVGNGYGEVNARISRLIELQDELSRALGADARKGGGLMKRLFSPVGGDVRRIFEEIRKETGIDLVKEATLAKFAMEGVGDVRQQSLLKQLDVLSQEASTFDLTKPISIIKFIRERADLDAQELANEIIRRSSETQ